MTSTQNQSSVQTATQTVVVNNNTQVIQLTPELLREVFGISQQMIDHLSREHLEQCSEAHAILSETQKRGVNVHGAYTIEYFPKDVDHNPEVVKNNLESMGFVVCLKEPRVRDIPTNAIWFGPGVPMAEVKLVALTLIRAGVNLRTIKPFAADAVENEQDNLIQIGADADDAEDPILSVAFIDNQTAFTRDDDG